MFEWDWDQSFRAAIRIGISVSEYDEMTPHQLNMAIEERGKVREEEQKVLIHQAYLISRWVWSKKIDIEKILGYEKEKKVMTNEQMLDVVKALNKRFGGEESKCES